jgi:hypothetical protein
MRTDLAAFRSVVQRLSSKGLGVAMETTRSVPRDVVAGALAGAAATWVMNRATTILYERENRQARQREDAARGGRTAYEIAAEKAAGMAGRELSEAQRKSLGTAVHWGLGIAAGVTYALLRRRVPRAAEAQGMAFGAAFWLLVDEGLTPTVGLTPGPRAFPWQTHVRGLVGHLVYGVVADTTLDLLERAA